MDCDFMFPGDSDPCNWELTANTTSRWNQNGFYWTEETGNNGSTNPPEDRRFMQSAGPFTLKPGRSQLYYCWYSVGRAHQEALLHQLNYCVLWMINARHF